MGLDYSINLYYRVQQLEAALTAVAAMADPWPGKEVLVTLPSGTTILLPFTSDFKCEPVSLAAGRETRFDTSLVFPVDEPIREYVIGIGHAYDAWRDSGSRASIGYIYLRVSVGQQYAELAFTAAETPMSRLFLASQAIQGQFLDMMRRTDALAGIINVEEERDPLLTDPTRGVELDRWEYLLPDRVDTLDADRFTAALLSQLQAPCLG